VQGAGKAEGLRTNAAVCRAFTETPDRAGRPGDELLPRTLVRRDNQAAVCAQLARGVRVGLQPGHGRARGRRAEQFRPVRDQPCRVGDCDAARPREREDLAEAVADGAARPDSEPLE
jgi:hypothetical protein